MRIRKQFLAAFIVLVGAAAYTGLNSKDSAFNPGKYASAVPQGDKGLHFFTFFLLTIAFYWIFETSRRRAIHITLIGVTGCLGVGSEILQAIIPNGRDFDYFDIVANLIGSAAALGLCAWYHRRMLERRRGHKYGALSGDEATDSADIELGTNLGPQESGVTRGAEETNIDEELDNWDENAADEWEEEEPAVAPANGAADGKNKTDPIDDVSKAKRDD